jgi:hypothetical protein
MKTKSVFRLVFIAISAIIFCWSFQTSYAQSTMDCKLCHNNIFLMWQAGNHSHTQKNIAIELAAERIGESADVVINGADAENCIACHAPLAMTTNGGMTDVQALEYCFTTTNGLLLQLLII